MNKYFIDVIKNHYLDYGGRATRTQFWMFVLWSIIVFFVLGVLTGICGKISNTLGSLMGIVSLVACLGIILPSVCIQIRRVRDLGISGWFTLLGLLGGIILFVFNLLPTNIFGRK